MRLALANLADLRFNHLRHALTPGGALNPGPTAAGVSSCREGVQWPTAFAAEQARIETEISRHRQLYLRAVWAGHSGEAEWHETEVDRLIGEWDAARRKAAGV